MTSISCCWYFESTPDEVFATEVRKVLVARGIDTPDAIQAQVRFADGAVATFEACWTYPNTFPTMTDSFIELIFSSAVIHLDRKREQIEIATEQKFEYPRNLLINRVGGRPSGSTYAAVTHFVDAVLDGFEPLVSLESSVRVTRGPGSHPSLLLPRGRRSVSKQEEWHETVQI